MEQREFRMPATGEGWRHYKGGLYTIVGMANEASGLPMVVYTHYRWSLIQLPPLFVRGLSDFLTEVKLADEPFAPRFQFERERGADPDCPFIHPVTGTGVRAA